jgi:hypothetical protein
MRQVRKIAVLSLLAAAAATCVAAEAPPPAPPAQAGTPVQPAAATASQGPTKVCLDVHTNDSLTEAFARRLRDRVGASAALSLAAASDSCDLTLHVPGNLPRFETAGGVMISTVVIVTSSSGRYVSASVTACRSSDLEPCAARAVAAAKLALLLRQ